MVPPEDASTPVCLKTGTEVELLYVPEKTRRRFGLTQEATAMFETNHWWWPDLCVLKNGRRVRLKKLQEGQVVRVLSVPTVAGRKGVSSEQELTNSEAQVATNT